MNLLALVPRKVKNFIKSHGRLRSAARSFLTFIGETQIKLKFIQKKIWQLADKKIDEKKLMINIGGGHYFRRHWRVLDFTSDWYDWVRGVIDYNHDLTSKRPFPISDSSVSFFFSAHTLEHIPQEYCQYIFNEIFRCLKKGGALRLTMPDFDRAYDAFVKNDIGFFVKYAGDSIEEKFLDFFATALRGIVSRDELIHNKHMKKEEFADYYTSRIDRETQKKNSGNHINWWNYEKAEKMLRDAGFKIVYRSVEQGSCFKEMRGSGRYCGFDSTHPEISLFVEAVK